MPGASTRKDHVKRDLLIAVAAIVVVLIAAFALSALSRDLPLTPSEPYRPETAAAAGQPHPDDTVVMRVNGEPVTEREFNAFLESAPAEARPFYASPAGRRAIADELVKLKALEQEARRLGVTDDPAVRTEVDISRSQIIAARALEKLVDERSDQMVAAEFQKERASSVTLRHILIAYEGSAVPPRTGGPAPSPEVAMNQAREIAKRIRAGAEFEEMARAESDDRQTAEQGGLLGPARPEQLPQEIASIVQNLQPGEISDPVRTQFGIHIFKAEPPSIEELRPMLRQRVRQQVAEETLARLQKEAEVELEPKFFPDAPQARSPNRKRSR